MSPAELLVEVQYEVQDERLPRPQELRHWLTAAWETPAGEAAEVVVRIVGEQEARVLNRRYRGRDRATNVLSFPAGVRAEDDRRLLGDVVICAPLVEAEAAAQGKSAAAHWAHISVHAMLHLQGHDHRRRSEARRMETREIQILAELGFPDPYQPPR